jgi:hypothetical protein
MDAMDGWLRGPLGRDNGCTVIPGVPFLLSPFSPFFISNYTGRFFECLRVRAHGQARSAGEKRNVHS